MSGVSSSRIKRARVPKCARCRNHGHAAPLKGHAGRCSFAGCRCWKCSLISERTRIMARQRSIRKHPGDPEPAQHAPGESATHGRRREVDAAGKTYLQLEAPVSSKHTQTADGDAALTSPHLWLRGPQGPLLPDGPGSPWPGLVSLIRPDPPIGTAPVVPPFHPANAFVYPAFLVPPPPLGFPRPPGVRAQQEDPVCVYAPRPRYPWPRENRPDPDHVPSYRSGAESPPTTSELEPPIEIE